MKGIRVLVLRRKEWHISHCALQYIGLSRLTMQFCIQAQLGLLCTSVYRPNQAYYAPLIYRLTQDHCANLYIGLPRPTVHLCMQVYLGPLGTSAYNPTQVHCTTPFYIVFLGLLCTFVHRPTQGHCTPMHICLTRPTVGKIWLNNLQLKHFHRHTLIITGVLTEDYYIQTNSQRYPPYTNLYDLTEGFFYLDF